MTPEIALLLAQDGISTGAIYVLVALGIVLIFLVTRVIFVPFGDVVGYSALTLAALQLRQMPGTVWLVLTLAALATVMEVYGLLRRGQMHRLPKALSLYAVFPAIPAALVWLAAGRDSLSPSVGARGDLRHSDRTGDDALLRFRLSDRPESLRRRHHRRPGQLSGDCRGRDLCRAV
jgi:hypothetical protein